MFRKSWPILLLFSLSGCGYTLSHRLKDSLTSSRGIAVRVFDNETDEAGAEIVFTNALIRELETRGEVVVKDSDPDAVQVRGTVTKVDYGTTVPYSAGFRGLQPWVAMPSEIGVTVSLTVTISDPKHEFSAYSGSFSGFRRVSVPTNRTYDVEAASSFGPIAQSSIESTFSGIARDIMRDVYDSLVEII